VNTPPDRPDAPAPSEAARLEQYERAARAIAMGYFDVEVPVDRDTPDPLARLGEALRLLATNVERRFLELRTLGRIAEQVNAGLVLDEVLDHVFESFRPIIPYDRIGVAFLNQDETRVEAYWARSRAPRIELPTGYSARLAGSSLEEILDTGKPRILNDLEAYLNANPRSTSTRLIVKEGMRSSLTCPLVTAGRPVGFLFFSSMERWTYAPLHVALFQQIAGNLSTIIEKSRLYGRLVELDQLKNRFLGMATHDLRNPLGSIMGLVSLLERERFGPISESQASVLGRVQEHARGMVDLIEELLDVNAIQAGHLVVRKEVVELGAFLRAEVENARPTAEDKGIEVVLELLESGPLVRADPRRLRQVVQNLLSNAIKYSHAGTTVSVGCEEVASEGGSPRGSTPAEADGAASAGGSPPMVRVRVRDQGQGIPAAEAERLFTDFGTTSVKPTGGERSTGLGLAIVKRIVEAHGGEVGVMTREGEGSEFHFTLPGHRG
jgi:signal transduction histidine kinase